MGDIGQRKQDHLDLCATDKVAFRERTNLLECVTLVHQALPELAVDDLVLETQLLGKTLRAPLIIAAMTGGNDTAAEVNRELSSIAEARGYGFGLGSQRAMQRSPETTWTYAVRKHAPTTLVLGNVGVVQARDLPTAKLDALVGEVGADALCVHLNPAMELVQPEGDRDFRGGLETITRLVAELSVPIVAKETGNGISRRCAQQLRSVGVGHVDVSGAGGTSWVGVETLRADSEPQQQLGQALWDWGVPTAASVVYAVNAGHGTIATGGIRTGLDVARALALGATAAGIARPVLQALRKGGREEADAFLDQVERELRTIMLLTGSKTTRDLRKAQKVLHAPLTDWLVE